MTLAILLVAITVYFTIGILFEIRFRNRIDGFEPIIIIYFWPFIMVGCAILMVIKFVKNIYKFIKEKCK